MGMLAQYLLVDDANLDELKVLPNDDLIERLEELGEESSALCDLDKWWDLLHYLLTGNPASAPLEGDPLSGAVLGCHLFLDDDEGDYVAYTLGDEIPAVANALAEVAEADWNSRLVLEELERQSIYPGIWRTANGDSLALEVREALEELLLFYHRAQKEKKHVVVSIY